MGNIHTMNIHIKYFTSRTRSVELLNITKFKKIIIKKYFLQKYLLLLILLNLYQYTLSKNSFFLLYFFIIKILKAIQVPYMSD